MVSPREMVNKDRKDVNIQKEIEVHEQELRALLTRVLPLRDVLTGLEAHHGRFDALQVALDDLNKESLPGLALNALKTEKSVGKLARDVESDMDASADRHAELLAGLNAQASSNMAQGQALSELMLDARREATDASVELGARASALGSQLDEAETSLKALVEPIAPGIAKLQKRLDEHFEALEKCMGTLAHDHARVHVQSVESTRRLRILAIGTLVLAGLGTATSAALLALSLTG